MMKPNNRQKKNLSFSNKKGKSKKDKKYQKKWKQKESEFVTVYRSRSIRFLGIRHRIVVRGYTCTTCLDR
jgi:hypothetical protein